MRTGPLRYRVTFEEPVETRSDSGDVVTTWTPRFSRLVQIQPLRTLESENNFQIRAESDIKMRTRWDSALANQVTERWRVTADGKFYNVVSCLDVDFRRQMIEIMLKEGSNRG